MNFIPDIRNLGGRKTISDMMSNHYNKMDCIRPILQTRESLNPDYKSLKLPEFKESIKRSQKPYQKRLNKTTMSDHYNNIKHMQRRIKDIGSVTVT